MLRRGVFFLLVVTPLLCGSRPAGGENREQLVLGCYSAPRNLDYDYFQLLRELGFSHTLYWSSSKIRPEQWQRDLDRAHRLKIRLIFNSGHPASIPEQWLDAVLETACLHPAFAGVYAPDEPGYRFPGKKRHAGHHSKDFSLLTRKCSSVGAATYFMWMQLQV